MPLIETKGAASAQGFGLSLGGAEKVYIEDVFSTYLYTGNGSTQTITNGINLSGKGGLVWLRSRNYTGNHRLFDTNRGATKFWYSNLTDGEITNANSLTAFNANGFSLGNFISTNDSSTQYASWTFRKQPKFFDVVTYTGAGGVQTVNHNLGSAPGCIIIKVLNNTGGAVVYHRAMDATIANQYAMFLHSTEARTQVSYWNNTSPTSTSFTVAHPLVNNSGTTYVAYLFAHDAGGFGLSGTDNVISCGSYTADGTDKTISLGYEPQWVMVKRATNIGDWIMLDIMRSWSYGTESYLKANTSGAEDTGNTDGNPTATGFFIQGAGNLGVKYAGVNQTMIYIAIRRGPMKVPTSGTSVFSPNAVSSATNSWTTGFPVDMLWDGNRTAGTVYVGDRLRGNNPYLLTSSSNAEASYATSFYFDKPTGTMAQGLYGGTLSGIMWNFKRAPGFFDVVCYTGTGATTNFNHNLAVAPELIFIKSRSLAEGWVVYVGSLGPTKALYLNTTNAAITDTGQYWWGNPRTAPTSTVFTVGNDGRNNQASATYVAYLFATCAGVSKVGSYTGTGSSQTINCGFTGGARFVLIKRTDSTGDWYVWDTARGIVAGNDPHLSLNSTAAEVTTNDSIDTDSTGFIVNQLAATNINVSSATYIFLAIA